jgi:hypothetical protein
MGQRRGGTNEPSGEQVSSIKEWSGQPGIIGLPGKVEQEAKKRCKNVLERHDIPTEEADELAQELVHQVGFALAGDSHKLGTGGRGRPLDGSANVLSVVVADILGAHNLAGNWLLPGDDTEDGVMGPVTEIEAILQTALREARGHGDAAMARPARVSRARKTLGKVHRE